MKIKKGDTVKIISGKENGKEGKVLQVIPRKKLVLVEGVNVVKKHQKPQGQTMQGGVIDKSMPIDISNVALVVKKNSGRVSRCPFQGNRGEVCNVAVRAITLGNGGGKQILGAASMCAGRAPPIQQYGGYGESRGQVCHKIRGQLPDCSGTEKGTGQ